MLSLFFGIVIVMVLLLLVLIMSREGQRASHAARQSLAYPSSVPNPPSTKVVNGVDTSMMAPHIHNEDEAIETSMTHPDDFSSDIDVTNLSKGASSMNNGYQGFEKNRANVFADKDA